MAYEERYVYSVRVEGVQSAIQELRELQQAVRSISRSTSNISKSLDGAIDDMVRSMNRGISGKAESSDKVIDGILPSESSATKRGRSLGDKFVTAFQWGIVGGVAFRAIDTAFGAITGSVEGWAKANVMLSDSLAELQIKIGATRSEAETYFSQMQQAAFFTGQDIQEGVYARTIEQRTNRPGLARGGMEFGLMFPEVSVQTATGNLLALQIQFGASFDEINEALLDTVQASGLTADQLLSLSDTWGPLSQELGMVNSQGKRTADGMRDISGLMAGMATVMGESGSTIENFLRKMSNFYTNPDIRAFLEARGIESVTGTSSTGIDIRKPFMDLMNEISAQAKAEPGFAVALQEFFPNQLGQPTQQQLQELIRNWELIAETINKVNDATDEWASSLEVASDRISTATERLSVGMQGFFAAIGNTDALSRFVNTLAAAFQNQAVRLGDPRKGYVKAHDLIDPMQEINTENILEWASSDNWFLKLTERRVHEMLLNMQIPSELGENRTAATRYANAAVRSFVSSDQFDPNENGALMAQSFLEFLSSNWNEALASALALRGSSIEAIMQAGFQTYSTQPLNYTLAPFQSPYTVEASDGLDTVALSAVNASVSIDAMASAAVGAAGIIGGTRLDIGDLSIPSITGRYERDARNLERRANQFGLPFDLEEERVTLYQGALPVAVVNADPRVLKGSIDAVEKIQRDADEASKKAQMQSDALARQAEAAANARAQRLENLFEGMFNAITRPTSVTASDLLYNAPGGMYQNKWDEPVRQMRADVNNIIAGRDLEYNFGGVFGGIFEPGVVGFAKGADQETKTRMFQDLQRQAEEAYYGFTLPPEAYNKEGFLAAANAWVTNQRQAKETKNTMKGWLKESGLGPEAMGFLDEVDEPLVVKMLTGGKSKEEITTMLDEKVPNVAQEMANGAKDVNWIKVVADTVVAQSTDQSDILVGAGQAMGVWLAKGSASAYVSVIVPMIIAAVFKETGA